MTLDSDMPQNTDKKWRHGLDLLRPDSQSDMLELSLDILERHRSRDSLGAELPVELSGVS
jgi:hypothetical protein